MYTVLPAVCCCEGGPEFGEYYQFDPCDDAPCCPHDCDSVYPSVYWCPAYAIIKGLPPPLTVDPGICLMIRVDCCLYRLTAVIPSSGVCPPGGTGLIFNVGELVGYKSLGDGEVCCDFPDIPVPSTCLVSTFFPSGTAHELLPNPCVSYVAQPYSLADQWGTDPDQPVTVTSTLTYCYETFGIAPTARCDNCPPITHYQAAITHSQQIGSCIPLDSGINVCLGQRTFSVTNYLTCAECNPCGNCCESGDPCEDVDPTADFCEDPANSYAVRTCYSVNDCVDSESQQIYFEQEVLTITFDSCISNGEPITEEFAMDYAVEVTDWGSNSVFGSDDTGIRISMCSDWTGGSFNCPCVNVFSGNAGNIADAINAMSMNFPYISAEADPIWGQYFWFGVRQTCDVCPGQPAGTRPAYRPPSDSDELVVSRVELVSATSFKVILSGRSKKKFICAAQTLISTHSVSANCTASSTDVVNCCISATGDIDNGFDLDCISPAEYAQGSRYSMRQVEQDYCEKYICTSSDPSAAVTGCDAVAGYPIYDVYVGATLVQQGWQSLCSGGLGGMPAGTQIKCRSYPYRYDVAPCCPYGDPSSCAIWEAANPTPTPCVDRCFQESGYYCESDATIIQVTT